MVVVPLSKANLTPHSSPNAGCSLLLMMDYVISVVIFLMLNSVLNVYFALLVSRLASAPATAMEKNVSKKWHSQSAHGQCQKQTFKVHLNPSQCVFMVSSSH